jgi:F420-dependent oxidoreductase-like protein
MRLGSQVAYFSWPDAPSSIGPTFGRIARNSEDAGLSSLWVMDHFFQIGTIGPPELDMVEGYTALAFAAGQTSRIELGTLVTGVTYRHPGVLAKTVTSLDVLSGGRAWLGIGAAWNVHEHRALGVPFAPVKERFERLEEALQICLQMWSGEDKPYSGRHYQLERTLNVPQSLRRPHPPILIGGGGEKKTLRLVAQYADACNLFDTGLGPEGLPHKLDVIRRHCDDVGRDYADIEKTVLARVALGEQRGEAPGDMSRASVDETVERFGRLSEAGIDTVIMGMVNNTDDAAYPLVAEVVRQVEPLRAPGRQIGPDVNRAPST